eukprot:TRINITY_DN658_c0_g1_i1.p2 TRINITY_DN658_c0_g1~~TRINITY_DN658_c0_g1_i1.p2  ORF type:complete len:522 (-),score=79.14 TRINITY_DN658_c0_g1_i1:575-2140(-)
MREIITLSLGSFSGAVAAQFWNSTTFRDAKSDVFYRGPITARTPRYVCLDFAEEGRIHRSLQIGEEPEELAEEHERVEYEGTAEEEEEEEKEEDVHSKVEPDTAEEAEELKVDQETPWWRAIVPPLHARFLHPVPPKCHHPSGLGGFPAYPYGSSINIEETLDTVRYYAEECDSLQGCNLILDATNGFGGLGANLLQALYDDLDLRDNVVTALQLREDPLDDSLTADLLLEQRALNVGFSLTEISSLASSFFPVDVAQWLSPTGPLQPLLRTGEIAADSLAIAAVLDSLLQPCRSQEHGALSLNTFSKTLRVYPGMRVAALAGALPLPLYDHRTSRMCEVLAASPFLHRKAYMGLSFPLLPTERPPQMVGKIVTMRGLDVKQANEPPMAQLLETYLDEYPSMATFTWTCPTAFPLSQSVPTSCISSHLTVDGAIREQRTTDETSERTVAEKLPLVAAAMTTTASRPSLLAVARTFNSVRFLRHRSFGRDQDEWREAKDQLQTLADEYADSFEDEDCDIEED